MEIHTIFVCTFKEEIRVQQDRNGAKTNERKRRRRRRNEPASSAAATATATAKNQRRATNLYYRDNPNQSMLIKGKAQSKAITHVHLSFDRKRVLFPFGKRLVVIPPDWPSAANAITLLGDDVVAAAASVASVVAFCFYLFPFWYRGQQRPILEATQTQTHQKEQQMKKNRKANKNV